jgi:hypothetical protein
MTPDETIALRREYVASDKAGSAEHTVTDRSICISSFVMGFTQSRGACAKRERQL